MMVITTALRTALMATTRNRALPYAKIISTQRTFTATPRVTSASVHDAPSPQGQAFVTLETLRPNPGAIIKKQQVGRGHASTRGKRSGRGNKGFKQRSHKASPHLHFEGGQSTIIEKFRKIGVKDDYYKIRDLAPLSLGRLQQLIDTGKLSTSSPITMRDFCTVQGLRFKDGLMLNEDGFDRFNATNIQLEITGATKEAITAIESCGGSIVTKYHNRDVLDYFRKPSKYAIPPADSPPLEPRLVAMYLDQGYRGYLSKGNTIEERYNNYLQAWKDVFKDLPETKSSTSIDEDLKKEN